MKFCRSCSEQLELVLFAKNKGFKSGYDTICRNCSVKRVANWRKLGKRDPAKESKRYYDINPEKCRFKSSKYRAARLKAIPKWANLDKIKEIYLNCPDGFHVDHVIPLQNKYVCGLHVENNLQIIPAKLNLIKGNDFNGTGKHSTNSTGY